MRTTSRGFKIFDEFKDSYGNTIKVQESSGASDDYCWIFVKNDLGKDYKQHMGEISTPSPHLTKDQAKRLIAALNLFVGEDAPSFIEGELPRSWYKEQGLLQNYKDQFRSNVTFQEVAEKARAFGRQEALQMPKDKKDE